MEVDEFWTIPLRRSLLIPPSTSTLRLGREASIRAADRALQADGGLVFLLAQRNRHAELPERGDFYTIGVIAELDRRLRLPNQDVTFHAKAVARGELLELSSREGALRSVVRTDEYVAEHHLEALRRSMVLALEQRASSSFRHGPDFRSALEIAQRGANEPMAMAAAVAMVLPNLSVEHRQELLEESEPAARVSLLVRWLEKHVPEQ